MLGEKAESFSLEYTVSRRTSGYNLAMNKFRLEIKTRPLNF